MNSIKGLIIKDFQTIKSYKSTILFMSLIFIVCAFLNNNFVNILPVFLPLWFGMLGISAFSYDDLAKADKYILTFPIKRKDVVKARYLFILILTLSGTLLGFLFTLLIQGIKTPNIINTEFLINTSAFIIGSSVGVIFIQSFQIPVMFKFGAEKGRIVQIILIIAFMIVISALVTILMNIFGISLSDLLEMLKDYLISIFGITIIAIYILSFLISCKIYEKKEI